MGTTSVGLLLIILLGAYFRGINLFGWDGGFGLHPDELFLSGVASRVQLPPSWTDYFDSATSPLNPRNRDAPFFVYGLFPITLTRATAELLHTSTSITHVGRSLSLLFDLSSIVMVFALGVRLHGRRVALLAALLMALTALSIQHAHFFTVDTFGTFFTLCSLYWALRIAQGGTWRSYTALGISIGLAMASSRIVLAALGLPATIAALQASFAWADHSRRAAPPQDSTITATRSHGAGGPGRLHPGVRRFVRVALPRLVYAGLLTLLTFRVFQPDAFIGSRPGTPPPANTPRSIFHGLGFFDVRLDPRYLDNLREAQQQVTGAADLPPSIQWTNRTDYVFPLQQMVLWGMGLPLGLVAWGGWLLAGWWMVRSRRAPLLVLWCWIALLFAWQGAQFVKPMRYLLPIYGPLILFAAWALVVFWDRRPTLARRRGTVIRRWLPLALLLVVVGSTWAWAWAFTRIYTRPHTRISASRWLLDYAPPGSQITSEIWDYPLPVHADGRDPWAIFTNIETAPYAEDEPVKYQGRYEGDQQEQRGLLDHLDQADYIVLSSNRVYDSIVRLPMRYPVLMRYYKGLFDGELGFAPAAEFSSYPTLLGIAIPDQGADEAFSVYDHPRVMIFRKTPAYSRARAEQLLLDNVNWSEIYKLSSVQGDRAPTALRFTPTQWEAYHVAGTWSTLFRSKGSFVSVLVWLTILELIGCATFVLLFPLLPMLPDRGLSLARTIGLLVLAYSAWLLGSAGLMAFTPRSVWLCAAPLLAGGGIVGWRNRMELRRFWRERRVAILAAEGLFLLAFAGLLVVRMLNPDLWHPARGGEKPMDLAFLTAVLKSAAFPPYDPWFAGGYINYYYFGYVIVGVLVHLTRIMPTVAYNLAMPTLFALAAVGCWGVVYNLLAPGRLPTTAMMNTRRGAAALTLRRERHSIWGGLLAVLLVLVAGNLAQGIWFLPGTASGDAGQPWYQSYAAEQIARGRGEWAFWDATRVVDGTINEFPFFTFLFGDLHAHLIVIPFSLATLGMTVALARARPNQPWRSSIAGVVLLGLLTGALRATNTWDYPTFTGLVVVVLVWIAVQRARRARARSGTVWFRAAAGPVGQGAGIVLLGALFFLPFTYSFAPESSGMTVWHGARTSMGEWLRMYGLWLFVLIGAGLMLGWRQASVRGHGATVTGILAGAVVAGLLLKFAALILLLPLVAGAVGVAWSMRHLPVRVAMPVLWGGSALGLNVMTEFLVVEADIGRMNTVFKFGMHAWILYALSAAVALPWLWNRSRQWSCPWRSAWRGATFLLLGIALAYPLTATPARIADRYAAQLPRTLDGMAYMAHVDGDENGKRFALKGDADAITWIQQHIPGSPVMLEAHLPSYRWGGRIAMYTGLPTLLGWEWHAQQQRSAVNVRPVLDARKDAIARIYGDADLTAAGKLLHDYGVEYVYVGGLERALYPRSGIAKFELMERQGLLQRIYNGEETQIYRVLAPAPNGILTTDLAVVKPRNEQFPLVATPAPRAAEVPASVFVPAAPLRPTPVEPEPAGADTDLHALEASVAAAPDRADTAFALALAYRQRQRLDDAAQVLALAAAANPHDIGLHHLWGDILSELGRYDAAKQAYTAAITAVPSASNINKLGMALLSWGRLDEAHAAFMQALETDPAVPEPHFYLGLIYHQQGNASAARSELERYLRMAPDGFHSAEAKQMLGTLP